MKHFITGQEFSSTELAEIIKLALEYKKGGKLYDSSGKILTAVFANPSLRTRLSFESGMKKMGGGANILDVGSSWKFEYQDGAVMNMDKQEHVKEAARVISSYSDLIALRKSELMTTASEHQAGQIWEELRQDLAINQLAKYSTVPVINMESNMYHPCQSMADVMTIIESLGSIKKKKYLLTWAPHPKALPLATPHSQLITPAVFGADVTLVCPKGFELDSDVMDKAKEFAESSGGSFKVSNNQKEAFKDADVVVAKSWASLKYFGEWEKEKKYREQFSNWIVNEEKMKLTNNALFLHCLPIRRNVVATDGVLDSPQSVIIKQAENRMWAQMAIVSKLLEQ